MKGLCHWLHHQPFLNFILRLGLAKLPLLATNLESSCFSHLSNCDYKDILQCLPYIILMRNFSQQILWSVLVSIASFFLAFFKFGYSLRLLLALYYLYFSIVTFIQMTITFRIPISSSLLNTNFSYCLVNFSVENFYCWLLTNQYETKFTSFFPHTALIFIYMTVIASYLGLSFTLISFLLSIWYLSPQAAWLPSFLTLFLILLSYLILLTVGHYLQFLSISFALLLPHISSNSFSFFTSISLFPFFICLYPCFIVCSKFQFLSWHGGALL